MNDSIMSDSTALGGFVRKWQERWPEWRVAEVFVPAESKESVFAWFALLQEFDDAFAAHGDPLPADAKLGWWSQELQQWQEKRSRHPLGRILEPLHAPWAELATALACLPESRTFALDSDAMRAGLWDYGAVVARIEMALFGGGEVLTDDVGGMIVQHTLAIRLMKPDGAEEAADATDSNKRTRQRSAAEWLRHWPCPANACVPRKLQSALIRQRLRRYAEGREPLAAPGSIPMLWRMWRSARGSRWNRL
ncbi:MAG: phytoene/squalene synthase family protein [Xanthomonadaceae bacterium]|jgi:hypothetical protein|nr:phytoene/squalene synthase family protein [Xanthomonadaceae bacterium]